MDKFEVKRQNPLNDLAAMRMIHIRQGDYCALKQMQEETGMKMLDLVHRIIEFCAERLTVIDEDDE